MERKEFVYHSLKELTPDLFFDLKDALVDKYITFSIIKKENVNVPILAEKLL